MRVSKNKLTSILEKESMQKLLGSVKNISSIKDIDEFLRLFFTEAEKQVVVRRFAVVQLLQEGKTYAEIRDLLEVSKNTISNARDMIEGRGYGRNPKRTRVYTENSLYIKKVKPRPLLTRKYKGVSSII